MKTKLYYLGGALAILALAVTFFSPSPIPLSPLASSSPHPLTINHSTSFIVMGFAPYWNLKKLNPDSLSALTHFAYFALHLNKDGTLYTRVNRREEDPGFTNYKRLLSRTFNLGNTPLVLTFMPESQAALESILGNPTTQKTTISSIQQSVQDSGAVGVNIDFEPLGDTPPSQKAAYTQFIQSLRVALPLQQLSISVYPSAAVRPRIWDLAALSPHLNYIVVMTYDYTMPNSNTTGPNSPLRGSGTLFEHDIIKNIAEISALVPSRQILLGIPLYGYEWETVDTTKYSPTNERAAVASLERIQTMLDEQTLELLWDRNTLTPYGISSDSGQISQVYFENSTSISLKLDFVKSANLGGIAIWALGYEGNVNWLWPLIAKLNQ